MNAFEITMLVMQAGASVTACWNEQYMRALYWLGALILTVAVMRGME